MSSNYPTALDTFPTVVDNVTTISATESNNQNAAIVALERSGYSVFNVKTYGGAKGDGSTDDSTAIQNTINAANSAGGGTVYFPPGTYVCSGLTIYGKIRYLGAGIENTILKLKNSSNTFLAQTNGFASLTGTNGTGGEVNWMIEGITLDGNKASNGSATVPVLRVYGYGFEVKSLRIRNGNNEGLYSEWSTSLPSPGSDSMMAFGENLKVHDCGSHGIHWKGPHDSMWTKGEVFNNGARGVFVDAGGDGLEVWGVHCWGLTQTYAIYLGATGCRFTDCVAEGAITAQLALDANDCSFNGFVYGAGASAPVGVEFGPGGTRQDLMFVGKINNCTSGALKFTNDGGSLIVADIFQSGGTLTTGTISINSRHTLRTNGVAGSVDRLNGGLEIHGGSTLKLYSAADSGFATLAFDGSQVTNTWPYQAAAGQFVAAGAGIRPGTAAGATQAGNLFMGSGVPSNSNGNNGDFYFRTDTPGTANQRLYIRSAGAWVALTL